MKVPVSGEVCEYVTEENYVFKFSEAQKKEVLDWASKTDPASITTSIIRNKVL